jgi:hypothetical protein
MVRPHRIGVAARLVLLDNGSAAGRAATAIIGYHMSGNGAILPRRDDMG